MTACLGLRVQTSSAGVGGGVQGAEAVERLKADHTENVRAETVLTLASPLLHG